MRETKELIEFLDGLAEFPAQYLHEVVISGNTHLVMEPFHRSILTEIKGIVEEHQRVEVKMQEHRICIDRLMRDRK